MPRRRTPTEDKRAAGTLRGDRYNPLEPSIEPGAPPMPAWLTEAAKREWRRLVPILLQRRVLSAADLGVLVAYCSAYGEMEIAGKVLKKEGRYYTNKASGLKKEHPAAKAFEKASQEMRLLANELGLSPAARSKAPSVPEKEEGDVMADRHRRRSTGTAPAPRQGSRSQRKSDAPVN
jgi:P27 family predicted phage terminase small subunit